MSYEDPHTGRDRHLGQEEAQSSLASWLLGLAIVAAIAVSALYFFGGSQRVADATRPSATTADSSAMSGGSNSTNMPSQQSSGPGIEGAEGGKNGPAAGNSGASTGASSGGSGVETNPNMERSAVPSQDSTGVHGEEGNKNGPAANTPAQQ